MNQNKNKEKEEEGEECISNRGRALEIHEGSETLPGRARCTVQGRKPNNTAASAQFPGRDGKQNPPPKRNPGEIGHPWPSDKPTVLAVHKHTSGVGEIVTSPASGPATERNPALSG